METRIFAWYFLHNPPPGDASGDEVSMSLKAEWQFGSDECCPTSEGPLSSDHTFPVAILRMFEAKHADVWTSATPPPYRGREQLPLGNHNHQGWHGAAAAPTAATAHLGWLCCLSPQRGKSFCHLSFNFWNKQGLGACQYEVPGLGIPLNDNYF